MTTKHTPGPWSVDLDQRVQFLDTDKRVETVIEIVNRKAGATPCYATNEDDARLIAAAPDLLVAANSALVALELANGAAGDNYRLDIRRLRAAIAKAESPNA